MSNMREITDELNIRRKFEKKKPIKNAFKNLTVATIYATFGLICMPESFNAIKIAIQNYKSDEQIRSDADYFNADLRVANYFAQSNIITKTNFKRMPYNTNAPIYVGVSSQFDSEENSVINNVISYYGKLFENINSNYKFKIVNSFEAYLLSIIGYNVIYIGEYDLKDYGLNLERANLVNFNFIKNSRILLSTKCESKGNMYYTLMHEMAHSFGLGDVYSSENVHLDTLLSGSDFANKIEMLYPNDVAILYAMYGQNYNVEYNLNNALQSFESYKDEFYQKASLILQSEYSYENKNYIEENILIDDTFNFESYYFNKELNTYTLYKYQINILDEDNASVKIYGQNDNLLWQNETKYDYYDGAVYFPSLYFEKSEYPPLFDSTLYEPTSTQFMALAKFDNLYSLFAPDSLFKTTVLTSVKEKNKFLNSHYVIPKLEEIQNFKNFKYEMKEPEEDLTL